MKRIIIVTGASSGLGWEFARQLLQTRKTDEIWLLARRKDRLSELAHELEATAPQVAGKPVACRAVETNLAGAAGVSAFQRLLEAETAASGAGGFVVDTLVNNAGYGTYGTFMGTDLERQLGMVELNVLALTGLCHATIPHMTQGSLIINVASLASFTPLGNFAVYGASKAYVYSFSLALAAELADSGIFVSTVCPGPVDTEFANVASRGARAKVVDGKSPAKVVAHCLRTARRGKRVAVMAPKWKFKAFMSRFIGKYAFARYTFIHEKRPSN